MKIQFNEAQLSRPQQVSLIKILDELQTQNENELVVTPVEFPNKLLVMLDDNIGMMLGWDAEKKSYAGLTTPESKETVQEPEPEPEPESKKDTVDLPTPEPDEQRFIEDHPTPTAMDEPEPEPEPLEPELVLSEIGQRVEALARALVKLSIPLNTEQRIEVWMKFCIVLAKELWK